MLNIFWWCWDWFLIEYLLFSTWSCLQNSCRAQYGNTMGGQTEAMDQLLHAFDRSFSDRKQFNCQIICWVFNILKMVVIVIIKFLSKLKFWRTFSGILFIHINSHAGYFRHMSFYFFLKVMFTFEKWVLKRMPINPLSAELNPICCLLALLGVHHFLHVSRIRVKSLTLRLLMSYIYIYGARILDVSRSHTTTQHSR